MKLIPIKAKKLLAHVKQPDNWFGLKYNMNIYRGCQHQCIYCDTRSECYQIENFGSEILYKENAIQLLREELAAKRVVGSIGLGSMNDPYMPIEKKLELTRKALEIIAEFKFPVHIITKSDLILRDLEILKKISKIFISVSFSITTADDELAKIIEPSATLSSARLEAIKILNENEIQAGIVMMPILPFIEDDRKNIEKIINKAKENNAKYILPEFGVTMRDRQRVYFYKKLDVHFPGMKQKYINKFGDNYFCAVNDYQKLKRYFMNQCDKYKIPTKIPQYKTKTSEQIVLF